MKRIATAEDEKNNILDYVNNFVEQTNNLNDKIKMKDLYDHYEKTRDMFYKYVRELGISTSHKINGYKYFRGIKIKKTIHQMMK